MEAAIVSALTTSTISISSAPPERPATSCSSVFFVPRTVPTTLQPRFRYSRATASPRPRDAPMINAELGDEAGMAISMCWASARQGEVEPKWAELLKRSFRSASAKPRGGDKSVLIVPITKALAPGALRGVGRHPSTQGDFGFVVKP